MKRRIDTIIIHCSATKAGQDFTASDIDRWHRERGFGCIGYHYVIRLDGKIEKGRDVTLPGAHCPGWNARSIGICYIGGLDANGRPADTRTAAQKRVLYQFIQELQREYPTINLVIGHRDTSPDLNGNGVIEPFEYTKACPCFDVKEFLRSGHSLLFTLLLAFMFSFLFSSCKSSNSLRTQHIESDSVAVVSHHLLTDSRMHSKELIKEHVDQTVLLFGADTINMDSVMRLSPLYSVTHTVIDRKSSADTNSATLFDVVAKDSVHAVHQRNSKSEVLSQTGKAVRWWLLGVLLVLVVVWGVGWRKRLR